MHGYTREMQARSGKDLPSRRAVRLAVIAAVAALGAVLVLRPPAAEAGGPSGLRIATFACDVTPPEGHPLCGGWIKPLVGVDDPELAKGIVLRDSGGTYVLCVVDWCELRNDAYDLFRQKLASAAGTTPARVSVHCIHAHNAPITDRHAQEILATQKNAPVHADLAFLDKAADRTAKALRAALSSWHDVTGIGTSSARVDRVASNRRVPQPDGTIKVRFSSTKDPELHKAPEGLIDPQLRSIGLYGGGKLLACLHYYATHPQSYYGDGRATCDFPGIARERLEKETGVFQLYFTGCAGNIAAGKYNDGTPPRRKELAGRMLDAMRRSAGGLKPQKVRGPISWRVRPVRFPLRKEAEHGEAACRKLLGNEKARAVDRIGAALTLSTIARCRADRPFELTCMSLGKVRLLHLPGEPFVEFQLEAQEARPDLFVAVAGYADCGTGYICTERSYTEGGYEPTASLLDPVSEQYMSQAIHDLLSAAPPLPAVALRSVKRIWDAAGHNAFTDLVRYRDQWFCCFREGPGHVSDGGSIRVIRSAGGDHWESAALISEKDVDLRDPKLSETPDGRLMLLGGWCQRPPRHASLLRSWAAFSPDGSTWTEPRFVWGRGDWLWRVVWAGGKAYGVAYGKLEGQTTWTSRLCESDDGLTFRKLASFSMRPGLTEAALAPAADGSLYCLHRRDAGTRTALAGRSRPPFARWTWRDTGFYFGGPQVVLHRGRWYAAGRWMVGPPRTVLARIDWARGTLEPLLALPSGGDTSYPGMVSSGKELWISYYSSHEGKASIYLARVATE